jgi:glycosyltransferase involved in cell wall biosynthesis
MKILATGMEWFEQIPGGLNQYFADYLQSMNQSEHLVEGLLSGGGHLLEAPTYIRDVVAEAANLDTYRRMKSFSTVVRDRVRQFQPDVFNPHFALYASLVTRSMLPRHIPIVTHFHGPWAYESHVEDQGNSLKKYVRYQVKKKIEQATYRRSDKFIVLSHYFQDILLSKFGIPQDRIHVIPGAINTDRFRPAADRTALRYQLGINDEDNVLFCARRLVRRMGIENLLRAMVPVIRDVPHTYLYIAGDGPLKSELQQITDVLHLHTNVRLLGRVSNEDLVRWYQAADLSIVPTITLEGFGLVTTESLASGTPVLGTPYGGTKEILDPLSAALLFRDQTPEAMAEKIISVLRGGCIIPSRQECRQHALQNYSWGNVAKSVARVFEYAIEGRKELKRYEGSLL